MSDKLNKNILATVIYYDGFNYPLTAFEIWKYLIRTDYYAPKNDVINISLSEVFGHLQDKSLNKYIEHLNGFYFLKGKKEIVEFRIANNKTSTGKIKKLQRVVWWLRFLPFVRMIGITGALSMKNAKASSDWDLLIALKYGKIWTGRTVVTGALHLFKKRRHTSKVADRVCLNFFVTDQSLEVITKDLFSASEYMFFFPLYGADVYTKFQIKNKWIRKIKPNYALGDIMPPKAMLDSFFSKRIREIGEFVFASSWIENVLKKVEKKRIMSNPKTHQEGSLIYANDDALVFLPNPHGPVVFEKFKEKIEQLNG
ncbi:MAG: hypothetical protein US57_C0018G0006 [Candidatus Moranbacteria bacterium GW2011_GWC2_37_73]|nr:MAG: hypothetical protein UR95_C0004G0006 [Parcubacteria group bacterium GW2011_GWC1_36_108]KKQ00036.1 MAG: hypothetical protein US09_C0023G0006 [Candidatus Moranbacteria bacterium GW2011_GWD1_36_198]KKQ00302.1 MAG: hypothetical protein US10_C0035G0006 [Candidatus Moranbacteria bacterium GW2011_GWD2_36_198]KKQ39161.1 MAG: hypothetical protein US57_C0018G0006 [Candidatus Moranbacteria bacterium GW2011_GWC2_37_73]HAS00296.1 hypothetical protein [Candidatus Moranbacteria bacterium]